MSEKQLEELLGVGEMREQDEPDPEENEDEDTDSEETEEVDEDEALREAGKKALDAERKKVRELKAQLRELKKDKPKAADSDELRSTIRREVAREFGTELAHEKAVSLLKDMGYKGNPARGAKLLDLDSVLDEDGRVDIDELREAAREWQEDEPQLFRRARTGADDEDDEETPVRRRVSGSSDLGRKKTRKEPEDPLAVALGQLVGRNELA
jgi:hypothetical protein